MSKFFKGFLCGSTIASLATLLLVKASGKENRQKITNYFQHMTHNATQLHSAVQTLNHLKENVTSQAVPQLRQTVKDVQTTIRHFNEENQPRIKRIQRHIQTLKTHLNSKN